MVDTNTKSENRSMDLKHIFMIMASIGAVFLVCLGINTARINKSYQALNIATNEYIEARNDASVMRQASDYLTAQVREFTLSGDISALDNYFTEVNTTKRRDKAVANINEALKDISPDSIYYLENSLRLSNQLIDTEYYAFRLAIGYFGYDLSRFPEEIRSIDLKEEDKVIPKEQLISRARELVFGPVYQELKDEIYDNVDMCTEKLLEMMHLRETESSKDLGRQLSIQYILSALVLLLIFFYLFITNKYVIKPVEGFVKSIKEHSYFDHSGVGELDFLADNYNEMFDISQADKSKLSYEAKHDALTDLYNRAAYDDIMELHKNDLMTYMILDIDMFKIINDKYGHAMGDKALQRVAKVLKKNFRSEDYICRLGGDEFVVIMINAGSSLKELVTSKITNITNALRDEKDGVIGLTLSIGIAFSDRKDPQGSIYEDADKALYISKGKGKDTYTFYTA